MFIVPISSAITPLNTMSQNVDDSVSATENAPSFADVFKEVLGDVTTTQQTLNENAADLVLGNIDDLHTVYNNITKAEVALETFVAIKDAAQTGYKELMQMSI